MRNKPPAAAQKSAEVQVFRQQAMYWRGYLAALDELIVVHPEATRENLRAKYRAMKAKANRQIDLIIDKSKPEDWRIPDVINI